MSRLPIALVAASLLAGFQCVRASEEPVDIGLEERVKVRLVLIDTLVMDKKGTTVPDLTQDDFELKIGDSVKPPDTFDVNCPIGAAADPGAVNKADQLPPPLAPGLKRRIVFAFDYYFLEIPMRQQVLNAAQAMIQAAKTPDEEIMIVALADGLRVEQRFTSESKQSIYALRRMEHDVTLWARQFQTGASGQNYFTDLQTLMDVLAAYDGPKAIVYFSQLKSLAGQKDLWFNEVAMHATAARTAIYPADPDALLGSSTSAVSQSLARFANQSGGRMPYYSGDLSVSYRRAQRDLSCIYTLGVNVDPDEGRQRREVRVSVKQPDRDLRFPELLRLFTDEEKRTSRARAAFVDPGPYESPLVRALAFPSHPRSTNAWDTLIALHVPMPVSADGADLNVAAVIKRGSFRVDKYKKQFHIDPAQGGKAGTRPVTVFGDTTLKGGAHTLTVVLSESGGKDVVSADTDFTVPDVLRDTLVLRGPLLARVVKGGVLIRADDQEKPDDTKLDEVIGQGNSFEPLLVHEIDPSDELLVYWNACVFGKSQLKSAPVVKRRVLTEDGQPAYEPDPIPLALKAEEKKLFCHGMLESLPPGTLGSGEYRYDISIEYGNGDLIAHGTAPLMVH